jgi:hypothetical protein
VSRRRFLADTGRGLLGYGLPATAAAPDLLRPGLAAAFAAGGGGGPGPGDDAPGILPKIELPPLLADSEKKGDGPPQAMRPQDRLGHAIVGLGHLALEEILPAFGQCRRARVRRTRRCARALRLWQLRAGHDIALAVNDGYWRTSPELGIEPLSGCASPPSTRTSRNQPAPRSRCC